MTTQRSGVGGLLTRKRITLEQAKARYDAMLLSDLTRYRNALRRHCFHNHGLDPPDMLALIKDKLGDKRFSHGAIACAYLATL